MKRKKRRANRNIYKIRRVAAVIVLIVLVLLIFNILKTITTNKNEQETHKTSVLLDNEVVTLEKEPIIQKDDIYISKTDIKNILDENIIYIENDQVVVTTFNKHIALLKIGATHMFVNDAQININGELQIVGDEIYLPITDLTIVYDIEIEYIEDTKTIVIDSTTKELKQAITLKKTELKASPSSFSKTVEKISRSEYVAVIGTEKKYKKIRTPLGKIGYVKASKISDETIIRENMIDEKPSLNIDELVILKNSKSASNILATYPDRNEIIQEAYKEAISGSYKGVNINFDKIDDIENFYRLVIEITPKFKEVGLIVAVTLNENLDTEKLEKIADYVIEE